ncbi:ROK family protein [Phytoactinopolyspora limicola]|uniref:ROK family protein n=1 Tax=Phytoactinopolyspora limicola TaxID=2715536 RepID=UPI00140B7A92|nr:ROK family protein [Phytoactinopolyspora limicola]
MQSMTPVEVDSTAWVRRALTDRGWLLSGRPSVAEPASVDAAPAGLEPVVGVDVGGTKIHVALVGPGAGLVDETVDTDRRGGRHVTAQVAGLVVKLSELAGLDAVPRRIGIGIPGAPDLDRGTVAHAPNVPGWDRLDVFGDLAERLGVRPSLYNDVNLAAWGERFWDLGPAAGDLAFVAVGTGIGLGLVLGDQLHRGGHGLAGEIGDLPFGADPYAPESLVRGPLETVVSGQGVLDAYLRAGGTPGLGVRGIFDAAGAGDPAAATVIDDVGRLLAMALRAIRAIVDPDVYVLGGGIGSRPETLAATRRWLTGLAGPAWRVRSSVLGPYATVAGALAVACADAA